jgi:nucleoid-associated protein YgaU
MGQPLPDDLVALMTSESPPLPPLPPSTPAPPTRRVVPSSSPPSNLKVAPGDTLTAIAERTLGDGNDWYLIMAANPGMNPDRLRVGQILKIPAKSARPPAATPRPIAIRRRSHRIGEGDTLTSIASDYYGDSQRWGEIFEANRTALGGNPDRLRVDVVLIIP